MNQKDSLIATLKGTLEKNESDKEKLKSENQMLRRNAKDMRSGQLVPQEELQKVIDERDEAQDKLDREVEERKNEIDFWV